MGVLSQFPGVVEAVDVSAADWELADLTEDTTNSVTVYIGGTGDIKVDGAMGGTATFVAHPVGYLKVRVKKIYMTGTTATGIVAIIE